jgi:hypothetical protein
MIALSRVGTLLLLLCSLGCSGSPAQTGQVADPKPVEVLSAHWDALQRRDWRAAYDRLHPDLKTARLTLKRFTALHDKRLKSKGFPQDIKIAGSEQTGDDVVVSFDVLYAPPEGGEAVVVPPRRKVTLRKTGSTWGLATHDMLAVGPWNQGREQ